MEKFSFRLQVFLLPLLALMLVSLLMCAYITPVHMGQKNTTYTDYGKFYQSSLFEQEKKAIYQIGTIVQFNQKTQQQKTDVLASNLNPPFFQLLFYPFSFMTYSMSLYAWTFFSLTCALASLCLVLNILKKTLTIPSLIYISLALLAYFPTYANTFFGQVTMPILLLLCISWKLLDSQKINSAAAILGIAASLKLFLLIFAVFFIARCHWKGLSVFILTIAACFLITLPFYGLNTYNDYLYSLQHINWYASNWNASYLGFFTRAFGSIHEKNVPTFFMPYLTKFLYKFFSFITLMITAFLVYRYRNPQQEQLHLDYALFLAIGLLLSPLGWLYYFPILIIPFSILIQLVLQQKLSMNFYLYICSAILLSSIPHVIIPSHEMHSAGLIWFWSGCYFYGLLMTVFLCMRAKNQLTTAVIQNSQPKLMAIILGCSLLPSFLGIMSISSNLTTHEKDFSPIIIHINWQKIPSTSE